MYSVILLGIKEYIKVKKTMDVNYFINIHIYITAVDEILVIDQ